MSNKAYENMETWIRGMVCLRWMTTIRQLNLRKDLKLELKLELKLHLKLYLKLWGTDKVALWMFALTWVKQGHETNQALDSHIGSFLSCKALTGILLKVFRVLIFGADFK